ncbi:MAG: class I SAM-dependent methyltransferase [Deltaproteobacteria bacterium]|nr:class I SAM-dependent methyltransferase [Deltaproteobacteria bacterium]
MPDKQITKDSQARVVRGWMFGLHATFIIDTGGRLGYFAELKRRGGAASAQELAAGTKLDPWHTEVWCRAACTAGILNYDDSKGFVFAPFMDEVLAEGSPDLIGAHILTSLARDYLDYPEMFRSGAVRPFSAHAEDFYSFQGQISAQRAPQVVSVARQLPGIEQRLQASGAAVMDVGSGSGTVLIEFAKQFPHCQVTGVEPFGHFQETSKRAIAASGLHNRIRLAAVGAEQIDFRNEFDLITMVQVFHEVPDQAKQDILRRCQQSLKPGGTLLLIDRCAPANGNDLRDRRFTMSIIEQWFEVTWGNIVNTRPEIMQMLQGAGFTIQQENADLMPTYWTFVAQKSA